MATLLCQKTAFPGPQSLMQRVPMSCLSQGLWAYSQLCGGWREGSSYEGGRKGQPGRNSRETMDLKQSVLWFLQSRKSSFNQWPPWGMASIDLLTRILTIVWAIAPGLSQSPWGSLEIDDNFQPSTDYFWSSLKDMKNSVCAQSSNKLLSNIDHRLGTELVIKVNKTHMDPVLNLGGRLSPCQTF